ncbi:MAG TPA: beta-ketoacyl-ACP synthase III [Planctomycetota bacterium]|nr:beta-ketoacyl-ACP synthase III [Planctomycetota bacterium]
MGECPRAAITGCGMYLPERVLTNSDLEKMVETSDEWITTRTGIKERRVAAPEQAASDLAVPASRQALAEAGIAPADLGAIVVATMTPDMFFPSTACFLQGALGAVPCAAFDLLAACSGYVYALSVAQAMVTSGQARHVLVVATEVLTKFTDYEDRTSCILFGDGAGATVVSAAAPGSRGEVLYTTLGADGANSGSMTLPGGGSRHPAGSHTLDERLHYIKLRGREVFQLAVRKIVEVVRQCLQACGLTTADVALLVPHQMNLRIIQATGERLGIPMERVFVNIDRYGNTGAATVPIALHEAHTQGRLKRGDLVVLVTFGAGLSWSGAVLRW